jgi:hypothetical protein
MRDIGLNLCDFFPKLFEFFRIFGDGGLVVLDGVLNLAATSPPLWASNPALCPGASCSWFFLVFSAFSFTPFGCSNYGIARVRLPGCQ